MTQKKLATRVLGLAMALLMVVTIVPLTTIKTKAAGNVDDFVNRCYQLAFQRTADPEGFEYWKKEIVEQRRTGVDVVHCFIFSDEYKAQNTSDSQFVKDLYTMFMGREPDQAGYDYWCGQLSGEMSREKVFAGFGNSLEFNQTCSNYGITAGYYTEDIDAGRLNALNLFVGRMYTTTLGRTAEQEGQIYWVQGLAKGEISGTDCAVKFIKSKEFEGLKLSNEEYVDKLYAAFMGRTPDAEGKALWVKYLNDGDWTRDEVFAFFAESEEFKYICNLYGITTSEYEKEEWSPLRKREVYTNGILTERNTYVTEGNEHLGAMEEELRFDEEGNFDYKFKYSYEPNKEYSIQYDESERVVGKNEHLYNENGMCLWSKFYNSEGVLDSTYVNIWTDTDPQLLKECIDYDGDKVKERRRETNEFDAKGNITSKVIKNNGKLGETYVYTYVPNTDKLLSVNHKTYNEAGTQVVDTWDIVWTYNADGTDVQTDYTNNVVTSKSYGKDGILTKYERYDEGRLSEYNTFEYENNGCKETIKNYSANNQLTSYMIIEYNTKGSMKSVITYNANGSATRTVTYVYTYK